MLTRKSIVGLLLFSSLISCNLFEVQDRPQGYPDYDFNSIEEIVYFDLETEEYLRIVNDSTIESAKEFLLDEDNYFKDELSKFNGVSPNFSLTLISPIDTLLLRSYPLRDLNGRLEFDFTEKYDPNFPMKARKVHRFYIKAELRILLGI